jgi:hypothetical protein
MAGIPETIGPVVGHVVDNMPAKAAGLQENDDFDCGSKPIGSWDHRSRSFMPRRRIKRCWSMGTGRREIFGHDHPASG